MSRRLASIGLLLVAAAFLGASPPAASMPANEFSTPQATLLTYFTLVAYGDMDALKKVATVPTSDDEKMITECGADPNLWTPHLTIAILEKFPSAAQLGAQDPRAGVPAYKNIVNGMDVKIDGDNAQIHQKGENAPDAKVIVLRKEMGMWKIVLKDSTLIPCYHVANAKDLEYAKALRDCYADTADDVRAGKYTGPVAAANACDARVKAVMAKYVHPATAPAATKPAVKPGK